MKKLIWLFSVCVVVFSMIGCTSNNATTESKESFINSAKEVSANDINTDVIENLAKAKNEYCDQVLLIDGVVKEINENNVELAGFLGAENVIDVHLSEDELFELQKGQWITVVGKTTDEINETTVNFDGWTLETKHFQMPVAYLVESTFEYEGILKGENADYSPAYNIEIGESNVCFLIYFQESVDTSELEYNQKIKFSAKAIKDSMVWKYYEAKIIE